MATVLLVDARRYGSTAWARELRQRGHDVSLASSGAFVLTMLERTRPDVVVIHRHVEEMDGFELCAIIRADPATERMPLVLLASRPAGGGDQTDADAVLPEDVAPAALALEVEGLLRRAAGPTPSAPPGPTREPATPAADRWSGGIDGSAETQNVFQAIRAIANGRRSGRLVLSVRGVEGTVVFDGGRPVHATFLDHVGEHAFTVLMLVTLRLRRGTFRFFPLAPSAGPAGTVTVRKSLQELLRAVAARYEASRRGAGAAEKPGGETSCQKSLSSTTA